MSVVSIGQPSARVVIPQPAVAAMAEQSSASEVRSSAPASTLSTGHDFRSLFDGPHAAVPLSTPSEAVVPQADLYRERSCPVAERESMSRGRIVDVRRFGLGGENGSQLATLEHPGGRREAVVVKLSEAEQYGIRTDVIAGTYHLREVASSLLDEALNAGFVPTTVPVTLDGDVGSAQKFVADARTVHQTFEALSGTDGPDAVRNLVDAAEVQRLLAFDFVLGNSDRHAANLMLRVDETGRHRLVAIDNGLTLPSGTPDAFQFPNYLATDAELQPEARAFIASMTPTVVAQTLADAGIDHEAATTALLRLARLQSQPELVATPFGDVSWRFSVAIQNPREGLSAAALRQVDATVAAVYG